jgi:hypothetical protein
MIFARSNLVNVHHLKRTKLVVNRKASRLTGLMDRSSRRVGSSIESEIVEGSLERIENLAKLNYPPLGHLYLLPGDR